MLTLINNRGQLSPFFAPYIVLYCTVFILTITRLPLPNWATELESKTSPTGQRLYKVANNKWYPSVTTVIGQSDPQKQDSLNVWRNNVGFNKAAQVTKAATDRGTAVHSFLDGWLDDQNYVLHEDTPLHIAVPYKQIKKQLVDNLTEIVCTEQCLVSHQLKTAGRVDLIGVWKGKLSIIDFKTANKKKSDDMIKDYFLQETTYSMMYYEMSGVLIENIVTIIGNETLFKPQIFERSIYPFLTTVNTIFTNYHKKQ